MSVKRYDLTLRNFNDNIIKMVLKKCVYNNIEEYEFETFNPKFDLFINITTNHVNYSHNYRNFTNQEDKYYFFFVPLSYLSDETKEYFFKKYFSANGYYNFDEYYLNYSYTMPCINIYILKKEYLENKHESESNISIQNDNTENINNEINKNTSNYNNIDNTSLFELKNNEIRNEPLQSINYKNLYCQIVKKKLLVRAYNLELDYNVRPNDYFYNTWNIFNTTVKYNKHFKAWVFPLIYKKKLLDLGIIFV